MIQMLRKRKRNQAVNFIGQANDNELKEVMNAVERRCQLRHPDWDVVYLALPKGKPNERERMLRKAISLVSGEDT